MSSKWSARIPKKKNEKDVMDCVSMTLKRSLKQSDYEIEELSNEQRPIANDNFIKKFISNNKHTLQKKIDTINAIKFTRNKKQKQSP